MNDRDIAEKQSTIDTKGRTGEASFPKCNHFMGWHIHRGHSYYRCLKKGCDYIDGEETFKDPIKKARVETAQRIYEAGVDAYNKQAEKNRYEYPNCCDIASENAMDNECDKVVKENS